jgi:hypothetical protein
MLGKRRRKRGLYDGETAELLRRAVERRPTAENLLAYARFRRDLGFVPEPELADELQDRLSSYRGGSLRHACNLLVECGRGGDVVDALPRETLRRLAGSSPAIAHVLGPDDIPSERAHRLAELHDSQTLWRDELGEELRAHRGSLCVVGNAGSLVGSGLGAAIDEHQLVVRFNQFTSAQAEAHDIGARVDVWVRAPDLAGFDPGAEQTPSWVVLSGADPRYHLASWDALVELGQRGVQVVTLPLDIWRDLVATLEAPPSAGVLFLAWAIDQLGGAAGIAVAGFQRPDGDDVEARYHHALPSHRGSTRHRWPAERQLLGRWQAQGLVFLSAQGDARD